MTIGEARIIQERLVGQLSLSGSPRPRLVAGVDCSATRFHPGIWAAIIVFDLKTGGVVETARAFRLAAFPYVPGYLAFREGPVILEAFSRLRLTPDLLLFDGQGIAHPRGLGIAAHIGVLLDLPSVGCAKSHLFGTFTEPGPRAGDFSPLSDQGREIGMVLRSRERCRPLFISPGHRISVVASRKLVFSLCRGFRLPEPTRLAHQAVGAFRKEMVQQEKNDMVLEE